MNNRLGQLVIFFRRIRRTSWQEAIKGNSAFAKELKELIFCEEEPIAPENLKPIKNLLGEPIPYEVSFNLSNRFDCQDWAASKNVKIV